ncbi:hypothetical protein [Thermosediminibacter oceani]|uniref:Ig domain-containing protein n=1 Tax=Thermosediminibacter oceani (strain ATCC BAA-1034 / DSM 16646 / JW/IW-1228P) TaxID=555079 RepID=D9S2Y8_THEOJ|nr:hypothetical protein [Thermosediminibacter oceani]ADL07765.1 Ig domain-containing protein [Thermosediminibacter oceani DSM 16646]
MSIFEISMADIDYILGYLGKNVLVNGNPARALISNTALNLEYDDKKIATIEPIHAGDIVEFDGFKFIILSEINGPRGKMYKALMRRCNAIMHIKTGEEQILKGYTEWGEPVYEIIPIYSDLPIFMTQKAIDIEGNTIMLPTGRINVIMQAVDCPAIAINATFEADGKQWKIIDVDKTKAGIYRITAERDI